MTVESFELTITELSTAQPFHIYTIELKNGQLYEIDYPGAMNLRQGVAVFTAPGGRPIFFDCDSVLQIIPSPAEDAA